MPNLRQARNVTALTGFLFACYLVAGLGRFWTADSIETWYAALNKPSWTPPDEVFGPVWAVLYTMMAVAAWVVYRQAGVRNGRIPLGLFALQLVLNLLWTYLFFAKRRPDLAFLDIAALWGVLLATVVTFRRVSKLAGALMVPYLLWVTYAAALNLAVWRLNG